MKKNTIILILFFLTCTQFYGQMRGQSREKIISAKIGYISNELSLSPEQAEKFWPVYNSFTDSIYALDKQKRDIERSIDYDHISEKEAINYVAQIQNKEKEIHNAEHEFYKAISKIISQKQFLKLNNAEHQFKKKLLQRIRRRD